MSRLANSKVFPFHYGSFTILVSWSLGVTESLVNVNLNSLTILMGVSQCLALWLEMHTCDTSCAYKGHSKPLTHDQSKYIIHSLLFVCDCTRWQTRPTFILTKSTSLFVICNSRRTSAICTPPFPFLKLITLMLVTSIPASLTTASTRFFLLDHLSR